MGSYRGATRLEAASETVALIPSVGHYENFTDLPSGTEGFYVTDNVNVVRFRHVEVDLSAVIRHRVFGSCDGEVRGHSVGFEPAEGLHQRPTSCIMCSG
jgi:hypothetical protein